MKKLLPILLAIMLCLMPMCIAEEETSAQLANPWIEVTLEEIQKNTGYTCYYPNGSENVVCFYDTSSGICEMLFTKDGNDFVFRMLPTAEEIDISGMYYDPWNEDTIEQITEDVSCEVKKASEEDNTAIVCSWYDPSVGVMFSLSTVTPNADSVDIVDLAKQCYLAPVSDEHGHAAVNDDWFRRSEDENYFTVTLPVLQSENGASKWTLKISDPEALVVLYEEITENSETGETHYVVSFEGNPEKADGVTLTFTETDAEGKVLETRVINLWSDEANQLSVTGTEITAEN